MSTSSDRRHILSVDDLSVSTVTTILTRAAELARLDPADLDRRPFTCGLLFLTSSLRTRLGFAAATARLGGVPLLIDELRWGPNMSSGESFADTVRTASGMVDVLVSRVPFELDADAVRAACISPFVNGGDASEHPTQALIDLFAITQFAGDIGGLRIGICGDLTMRASRSLIGLFNKFPPQSLTLIAPPSRRSHGVRLEPPLSARTSFRDSSFEDLDVVYMAGLPEGEGDRRLADDQRAPFVLTAQAIAGLPAHVVITSPLPVIDEIAPEVRDDQRMRAFEASDLSVFVRMAVLERGLGVTS